MCIPNSTYQLFAVLFVLFCSKKITSLDFATSLLLRYERSDDVSSPIDDPYLTCNYLFIFSDPRTGNGDDSQLYSLHIFTHVYILFAHTFKSFINRKNFLHIFFIHTEVYFYINWCCEGVNAYCIYQYLYNKQIYIYIYNVYNLLQIIKLMLCLSINYAVINILYQHRRVCLHSSTRSRSAPLKQIN